MDIETPTDRRILVTGGAGFIGSHLVDALASENDVVVLDSFHTGTRAVLPDDVTLIDGDVRHRGTLESAVEDVDCIFHEAALVSVQQSVDTPTESHAVNVDGTLDVLELARRTDARVIFASSAAIYGHPETVPVRESDPKTPTSPYGLEKLTGDHYVRLYADLYGLEGVSLRYFNVYGPGQPPNDYSGVISIFLEQALNDEPVTVHGDGEQTRDFVFVEDVVRANVLAATTAKSGRAYNVGTGEQVTICNLAEAIVDITDSNSEIIHTEGRPGDVRHSRADISRARNELGYEPTVSLRNGLERTLEWFEATSPVTT